MAAKHIESAKNTYDSFIGMLKWAVPLICFITLIVVVLIAD